MEFSVSLGCVLFAVLATAHGVFHAHLNEGDFSEMVEWLPQELHGERVRRDVSEHEDNRLQENHRRHKPRQMIPPYKYCCGGENNTDLSSWLEIMELAKNCMEKVDSHRSEWEKWGNPTKDPFSCDRMRKFMNNFHCVADCMMEERGVLNKDGSVNLQLAKEYFTKPLIFDWLKDVTVDAVEKCAAKKYHKGLQSKTKCSTRAMDLYHCVSAEVILTCPEEHLVRNDYCSRVRDAFKNVERKM